MAFQFQDVHITPSQTSKGLGRYNTPEVDFRVVRNRDHSGLGNVLMWTGMTLAFLGGMLLVMMKMGGETGDKFGTPHRDTFGTAVLAGFLLAGAGIVLMVLAPKQTLFDLEMHVPRRNEPFKLKRFGEESEAQQVLATLEAAKTGRP